MGMNEDNRKVFRASPIDPTDGFLCEVLNDIAVWIQETNAFEDEEDAALESAAICGRGFCAIDFAPDPKKFGEIEMSEIEVSVHEVHFDPAARRTNLEDAGYLCWDRWLNVEDFKMRYPKIKGSKIKDIIENARDWRFGDGSMSTEQPSFNTPVDTDEDSSDYNKPLDLNFYDASKQMIRVIHMEYWEAFTRYYIWDPKAGKFEESPEKPTKEMKDMFLQQFGEEMTIETMMDKRVKWLQFTGDMILLDDISPLPFDGFSVVPMFAYSDVSKRTMNHFGLVKLMKDPQKEINKRWSQTLNMLNNQVAPGIFAETDAFVDEQQAKQSMKTSGDITWTNSGSITGGKFKERTVPTFPNAPMQMEQFSQDIMKKITGINPDLLGQDRGRQEPGVVIRLRQQQGVTLLKPLFRNFNRMKKDLFKRQLAIIMEYMPDDQILRILGQNERYQFTSEGLIADMTSVDQETEEPSLVADIRDVRNLEYNVGAEEAPGNMGKRMMELSVLMEMMQTEFPVDPLQVIEKLELPASEKQRWIQYITSQQDTQTTEQEEAKQFEIEKETKKLEQVDKKMEQEFMVDIAKINQMAAKDDKKMAQVFAQMKQDEKAQLAQFMVDMISVMQQEEADEAKVALEKVKQEGERQKNKMEKASHGQDMKFDKEKQGQDIKFAQEKQTQGTKFAKEKQSMATKFAKEKNNLTIALQKKKGEADVKNAARRESAKERTKANPKKP
ncbi:MAG: hypothetical protein DRI65_13870 [Chloroflexota bacterium]|nr:MAG: hypothetical protein DRI65_13870 [Chloroflexota bacterium]